MVQYEIIDMSMRETVSDDMPTLRNRLVADNGWIMNGGAAHVGSVGVISATRSATSCRACSRSVPGLKIISICESWMTDLERMMSSPSTPARACSSGTVTRFSTSSADRPMQMVWISTFGGANSGKTSTGIARTWDVPKIINPAAAARTRKRNRRLRAMTRRIMVRDSPRCSAADDQCPPPTPISAPYSSAAPVVTTDVPTEGPADRTAVSPSISSMVICERRNTSGAVFT